MTHQLILAEPPIYVDDGKAELGGFLLHGLGEDRVSSEQIRERPYIAASRRATLDLPAPLPPPMKRTCRRRGARSLDGCTLSTGAVGGAKGTRTLDPCDANAVLCQLSYRPGRRL